MSYKFLVVIGLVILIGCYEDIDKLVGDPQIVLQGTLQGGTKSGILSIEESFKIDQQPQKIPLAGALVSFFENNETTGSTTDDLEKGIYSYLLDSISFVTGQVITVGASKKDFPNVKATTTIPGDVEWSHDSIVKVSLDLDTDKKIRLKMFLDSLKLEDFNGQNLKYLLVQPYGIDPNVAGTLTPLPNRSGEFQITNFRFNGLDLEEYHLLVDINAIIFVYRDADEYVDMELEGIGYAPYTGNSENVTIYTKIVHLDEPWALHQIERSRIFVKDSEGIPPLESISSNIIGGLGFIGSEHGFDTLLDEVLLIE